MNVSYNTTEVVTSSHERKLQHNTTEVVTSSHERKLQHNGGSY
jgi:hypothetical protein